MIVRIMFVNGSVKISSLPATHFFSVELPKTFCHCCGDYYCRCFFQFL